MEETKGGEPPRSFSRGPSTMTPMIVSSGVRDGVYTDTGAGAGTDVPEFSLCAALVAHTGDVRSLAVGEGHLYSGARDKAVMAWPLDENRHINGTHTDPAARITLPGWVNALTVAVAVDAGGGDERKEETVVAGCNDGGIYAMVWEGARGKGETAGAAAGGGLVVKTTLLGHTAPISSLSWTAEGLLLSGSWDETAKAWDLDTATCTWTLGGHENSVCVLGLGPGSVATGSTGLNVDGRLVGQQIRMWEGFPPKECRSLAEHTSGIRDLCLANANASSASSASSSSSPPSSSSNRAFCSASNDGTVRAWSSEGDCRAVFAIPDDSFVFSVSHLGDGLVAAGDDAGNLCAARVPPSPTAAAAASSDEADRARTAASPPAPPVHQNATVLYKHPKTVWSVAALRHDIVPPPGEESTTPPPPPPPSSSSSSRSASVGAAAAGAAGATAVSGGGVADVATGSADYAVRIFTPDSARALRGDRLKEAEEALAEGGDVCTTVPGVFGGGLGSGTGSSSGDRLPSVSEMGVMVGAEDGQLSAFVDEPNGAAQVFRWVQAVGGRDAKWEPLGTLRPPVRKVPFEGGLFDKVIPVEVESASRGFLTFQLGVNDGDDPKSVASAFCQKHSLGPEYLPQIEQFLFIASL
ncbi:unnamed protein product [Pylaiella littoralis]